MSTSDDFSRDEIKAGIESWLNEQGGQLPGIVRHALASYITLIDTLDAKSSAMRKLLKELRTSFGIIPSSEKRTNYGRKRSRRQRLLDDLEDSRQKARKHESQGRKQRRRMRRIEDQLKELDDIELTPEELAEIEANDRRLEASLAEGGEVTDLRCAHPDETLVQGLVAHQSEDEVDCPLDDDTRSRAVRSFTEQRERLDIKIDVINTIVNVEKAELPGPDGPTLVSASTRHIGPPKMGVTWDFLAQMSILVGQYGMPLSRFSSLVSTPEEEFGSERASRYFQYVARRLLPVYQQLIRDLAQTEVLAGDDTSTRTLEVERGKKRGSDDAWRDYATPEQAARMLADNPDSLAAAIGSQLQFVTSSKASGKAKRSFQTTVAHGRYDPYDPKSTIVLFRSHFGSFGDLVQMLLRLRAADAGELTVLSDLASVNNFNHDTMLIKRAGCASHARRRFAKGEDEHADWGGLMLSQFGGIYAHEEALTRTGRNFTNTQAVRQGCSRPIWEQMRRDAEEMKRKFSSSTQLGEAARYLLNNYETLTAYLDDPRLPLTNDMSERLLRPEKQIQAVALFRNSLEGRFALDVIRSLIQTSVAAKTNAASYLSWLLQNDPADVEHAPRQYTPLAYLAR